jgi:hypothetical protein
LQHLFLKATPEGVFMDDDSHDDSDEPVPAWHGRISARDMLGLTDIFVRDALTNDHGELYETYGLRPDEAARSLRYVELAQQRAWGVDEMVEAPIRGQSSSESALRRRILMAMKAEGCPEYMHPGDAVLLMERSGLMLCNELRDAVVSMCARNYGEDKNDFPLEDENRLRRLLGRPVVAEDSPDPRAPVENKDASSDSPSASLIVGPAPQLQRHLITNRVRVLSMEIEQAVEMAGGDGNHPVWAALSKLAETKHGALTGFVSEGVQYRGSVHQETGEPDILTFKQLCDRLRNRRKKRDRAG